MHYFSGKGCSESLESMHYCIGILRIYHQTESVTETIRILGYPTRRNLYTWIAEENTPPKTRKEYPVINNPPDHPRNPPLEVKLDAIHRCYELGENIKYVSEDIGYSRASIYQWRKRYLKEGTLGRACGHFFRPLCLYSFYNLED